MRRTGFAALVILSLGVGAYAIVAYALLPLGAAVHPDMCLTFASHDRLALYAHVFAATLALALGPFQFAAGLRAARPALHRWSGRLYLGVGVLLGGLAGLIVAFNAFGGPVARVGFVCLAAAWLFSGGKAYLAIRSRDVAAHRRWMVRNFALTFAAVTLRLWLPGLVGSGTAMELAYPIVAWLCWVPNLVVAELLFNQAPRRPTQPTPAS
ncbi:MAG: hypothetical protein LKCHEGNO_00406 [Burkholderiaceae bacterium]|nr:hypothetical protein [Burkholderiaceae bacterium]